MSIVRLANKMTRGPVVASPTDSVSMSACRTMPVPTKPACFDDPACLSKVVELVYCDQAVAQYSAQCAKALNAASGRY